MKGFQPAFRILHGVYVMMSPHPGAVKVAGLASGTHTAEDVEHDEEHEAEAAGSTTSQNSQSKELQAALAFQPSFKQGSLLAVRRGTSVRVYPLFYSSSK